MKNVKVILAAIISTVVLNTANAQTNSTQSEEKKQEIVNQLQENKNRLSLTKEQEAPFNVITKKYAQKLKDLRTSSLEKAQKLQAMKDLRNDKNGEIKTVLSEEQYKIYLQLQEERKTKIMQNRNK